MICCGDEDTALAKRVDVLQEAVHNALELAEFVFVVSAFGDYVKFVEEQNTLLLCCVIEDLSDVFGRAAKQRGDQAVKAGGYERKSGPRCDIVGDARLAAAWGAIQQEIVLCVHAVSCKNIPLVSYGYDAVNLTLQEVAEGEIDVLWQDQLDVNDLHAAFLIDGLA